uniref:Cns1/TTC4 wheel domain-containing protein n=1 Tax=Oryza punctata TaxID=4537 RepID=A0A0E0KJ23_ORYPU
MALLMDPGAGGPLTESEKADLDAINAIKESAAAEYKEKGNRFVKMGRSHYADAVDCYTKAITQMEPLPPPPVPSPDASVLFANRAHVNLLLGNHRRALDDAARAVQLSPSNVKAYYRAAKAAIALSLLSEAASFCRRGLEQDPANEELKKLLAQVDAQQSEQDRHRAKVAQAVSAAKDIVAAMEKRGLTLGKATYQELTGVKKPKLDEQGVLHWPVLLLYPEVMSSDFIEDFPETDTFVPHLDAGVGTVLSKSEILKFLLEGTVDSKSLVESLLDEEDGENYAGESSTITSSDKGSVKWINVKEGKTLQEVLKHKDFIIPAIPVFFVVSRKSTFYREFKAGNWSLP